MKFYKSQASFLSIISVSSLLLYAANALDMTKPTFRDLDGYKNIAFSAFVGGSSHYNWVLSIGEELGQRGHNFSFLTWAEETRHGKPYARVKTVEISPGVSYDKIAFMKDMSDTTTDMATTMAGWMDKMSETFERDYLAQVSYFENNKIDVALCDHFNSNCVYAANAVKIPYIITESLDVTTETAAPYINHEIHGMKDHTSEFQGFQERFINKFIGPWTTLYKFWPHIVDIGARKRALGIEVKSEAPHEAWKDSLKLINSVFGFVPARRTGPLAEYVGPIITKQYAPLTEELEEYLNAHKHLAYIGFGQHVIPSKQNIKLILASLLESTEEGFIDGFLWAINLAGGLFPDSIITSSNTTYNVQEMFNQTHAHARIIKWAPQRAVLFHPSTAVFVSHGGSISWFESMYSATSMIMFPFFGDQPGNALIVERSGLGGILKSDFTVEQAVALFKKITTDESGEINANVKRMRNLIQIHSEHAVIRGADMVEEVAYTNKNGKLPHRESANRRMSYIKSHNLDLYAALLSVVAATSAFVIFTSRWVILNYLFANSNKKQEQHKMKLQ